MKRLAKLITPLAFLSAGVPLHASAGTEDWSINGQLRASLYQTQNNQSGALAELQQLGVSPFPASATELHLEHEINLRSQYLQATLSSRIYRDRQQQSHEQSWLNEAYTSHEIGAWQLSLGRKIMSWDVAYGFRPNDIVQQEQRRSLYSSTLTGKDLVSAEYFNARQSLALVSWRQAGNNTEAANQVYAMRAYQRLAEADWYGFARYSATQNWSLGTAFSWVANEALELHGSYRYYQQRPGLREHSKNLINLSTPWQVENLHSHSQVLIGATYTTPEQHSLYFEYWYDGLALSSAAWNNWQTRQNQLLQAYQQKTISAAQLAPQLAWQSQALSVAENLRQHTVFLRWSWQQEAWQYAADLLWHPEDRGRIASATISWQGDRSRLEFGARHYAGPDTAAVRQLADRSKVFVNLSWSY